MSGIKKTTKERETDKGKGILRIGELTFKSRLFVQLAVEFGARGLWLSKQSLTQIQTLDSKSRKWIRVISRFEEVLVSLSSPEDIGRWLKVLDGNCELSDLSEKITFVLPVNDALDPYATALSAADSALSEKKASGGDALVGEPRKADSIEKGINMNYNDKNSTRFKFCREIVVGIEDYEFDYEISRFKISQVSFTPEEFDDKDVSSNANPPISRYLVSFTEDQSHVEHRRDLYREWDLLRAFLIKRSTSSVSSSIRYPHHLLFHRTPIYLASSVSSSRQLRNCVRQTLADGVIVDFSVAFDNPGVFDPTKSFATIVDVMERLGAYVVEEEEEEKEEEEDDDNLTDWKETLRGFWQRRVDALSSPITPADSSSSVQKGQITKNSVSALISKALLVSISGLERIDSMRDLGSLIQTLLRDLSTAISSSTLPSFLSIACFASGDGFGQDHPWQRASGFESLKTAKKSKEQKFAEKKEKLKENARRKKEIAKLRRRFVRTSEERMLKESDEENEGDKEDDIDDGRDMTGVEDAEIEAPQQSEAPLRRAEIQTLDRQRVRSALSAAYTEEQVKNVLKIAIDLSFGDGIMSDKEMGRLAIQIRRIYGSNRHLCDSSSSSSSPSLPVRLDLFGLSPPSPMREKLRSKFTGFEEAVVGKSEATDPKSIYGQLAEELEFVVLTPDSENILTDVSASRVYILGGLVDESVTKNLTLVKSISWNFTTARLPIQEFMERSSRDVKCGTSFNPVLTVNQVFDILTSVFRDGDWRKALAASVPRRKGFVLK